MFVPLVHRTGDEAQVDFFEVSVEENAQMKQGVEVRDAPDVLRQGLRKALRHRADQLSFLDAHVRAFSYLGGVPRRIVYDNLTAAVKKIVGSERELTPSASRLWCSQYLFELCFTRPGEGHDKGGAEARRKGIRLAHLTSIPRGETLSEISDGPLAGSGVGFRRRAAFRRGTPDTSESCPSVRSRPGRLSTSQSLPARR